MRRSLPLPILASVLLGLAAQMAAAAETVVVKYRGPVSLAPFTCEWTSSSLVKRLCYDAKEQYVVVSLQGSYYHYCEVPASVVKDWRGASSLGSYFNANIKGRYDCRVNRVPSY